MKIVSISQDFFDLVEGDRELMLKHNRPCIVVVRLRFRGKRRDFAVPLRSNIAPNVPKDQYFALPPRPTTRPGCRHGIHYIKMFPITKSYQRRFRTEGRPTTRRSSASSTATPSALSPSARHTSTATIAREDLALPSTSTASWGCWRARSRAPQLSLWFALLQMAVNVRDASACASASAAQSAPPPHPRGVGFSREPIPVSLPHADSRELAAPWCSSPAA